MTTKKIPIDEGANKRTIKARTDLCQLILQIAPNSPLYQAHPAIQDAAAAAGAAGIALASADVDVKAAEAVVAKARGIRRTKKKECDGSIDVYVALAGKHALTAEEVAALALTVRANGKYSLAGPISVLANCNFVTSEIDIYVKMPPGKQSCVIEISPQPAGPDTWKQLPGTGAVQTVGGYPPGTYLVRAACSRAKARSAFTTPVMVIVK